MIHVKFSLYLAFVISTMVAPLEVSLHKRIVDGEDKHEVAVFTGTKSQLVKQIMERPNLTVEMAFRGVLGVDEYPHIFLGEESIEYKSAVDIWALFPEEGKVDLYFEARKYPVRCVRGYRHLGQEMRALEIDLGVIKIVVEHHEKLDHSYRLNVLDHIGVPVRMISMSFKNKFSKAVEYSLWHEPIYMNSEAARTLICKPEEIVRALQILECTYNEPESDHDISSDEESAAELVCAGVHIPAMKLFFASRGCNTYNDDPDRWKYVSAQKFIHDVTAEFGFEEGRVRELKSLLGEDYARYFNT